MSVEVARVTVRPWTLQMRQPFVTARGRRHLTRNLLLTVTLGNHAKGVGEASESLAWPEDSQPAMRRWLHAFVPRLIGAPLPEAWRVIRDAWHTPDRRPAALAALECALASAEAQARGVPLWRWLACQLGRTPTRPSRIATSYTISAWETPEAARAVRTMARRGFTRFKVKITGAEPDADLARVIAVHRAAPRARMVLDANQGFTTAPAARDFLRTTQRLNLPIDGLEQPVPRHDLDGLAWITRHARVPVIADESAASSEDVTMIIRRRAAHAINIKLAKSGLIGALEMIRLARRAGLKLMIGCMAESAVGLTPSVHLACGTGFFTFVDLDSFLLVKSAAPGGFTIAGPRLSVTRR